MLSLYGSLKVKGGVLGKSHQGRVPLRNPSERVWGTVRYRKLARQASKWYDACKALSKELSHGGPGLLRRMLKAMGDHPTIGYPGREDYGHIRICRLFMYALDIKACDGEEDWFVYRRCSAHVAEAYEMYNICSYADALCARGFMRGILGMPSYSLSDLTMYICLQGHRS